MKECVESFYSLLLIYDSALRAEGMTSKLHRNGHYDNMLIPLNGLATCFSGHFTATVITLRTPNNCPEEKQPANNNQSIATALKKYIIADSVSAQVSQSFLRIL